MYALVACAATRIHVCMHAHESACIHVDVNVYTQTLVHAYIQYVYTQTLVHAYIQYVDETTHVGACAVCACAVYLHQRVSALRMPHGLATLYVWWFCYSYYYSCCCVPSGLLLLCCAAD
jgi:hypothetical protein